MKECLPAIKDIYWSEWLAIKKKRYHYKSSKKLQRELTSIADDAVNNLYHLYKDGIKHISLVALGGYARMEMSPFSDIDLLILHKGTLSKAQKLFIEKFTRAGWDLKINFGTQIKGIKEIESAARGDDILKTSLLDNRFINGDYDLFIDAKNIIEQNVLKRQEEQYLITKISNVRERSKKFRDSIYRLEPNIKESRGGIRDINTIYWICYVLYKKRDISIFVEKNVLTVADHENLQNAEAFIYKVRNELHYCHNRKYENLNLEAQQNIARNMGFLNTSTTLAVELFMEDYYYAARTISKVVDKIINTTIREFIFTGYHTYNRITDMGLGFIKYKNQLTVKNKDIFKKDPSKLLIIFILSAERSLKISDFTSNLIKENIDTLDKKSIRDLGGSFLSALCCFPHSARIVSSMVDNRVLQTFIPEYENIICKPQFNYYHHYTVDEHIYLALGYIDNLSNLQPAKYKLYQDVYKKIKRKDLLLLSIILHDIGKGLGGDHSLVGANITKIIGRRFEMPASEINLLSNIVKNHLLMSNISGRRDLQDIEVIRYFISQIGAIDELQILFLLTYADIRATGKYVFNEWKNSLLKELYRRTEKAFAQKDLLSNFNYIVNKKKMEIAEIVFKNKELLLLAEQIEDEYIYSNDIKEIIFHLNLASSLTKNDIVLLIYKIRPRFDCIEFTICAFDSIGLLQKISGVFASFGLNILGARTNTFSNNVVVDTIQVKNPPIDFEELSVKMILLETTLKNILHGTEDILELMEKNIATTFDSKKTKTTEDKIIFDNKLSNKCTIIDIYTKDSIGLLHTILAMLVKLKLNVVKAKISTDVDRVVDSFYVVDKSGNKIEDDKQITSIKKYIREGL